MEKEEIKVEVTVQAPVEKVWRMYSEPEHIVGWNFATEDWQCPQAENDLRPGGRFSSRMEAKDGTAGFDFGGTYDEVTQHQKIAYTMDDGRRVQVVFTPYGNETKVVTTFEAE